jgi:hypothetical protein
VIEATECLKCGAVLLDEQNGKRDPCPICSGKSRRVSEHCEEELAFYDQYRAKGKHHGKGRPFFEEKCGADFCFKDQIWYHLVRIVDRENDLYREEITDLQTGKVIRSVFEPLSAHRGHGSANNSA